MAYNYLLNPEMACKYGQMQIIHELGERHKMFAYNDTHIITLVISVCILLCLDVI